MIQSAIVYSIFILSGATALAYQVIWSRWLGLVFGNTAVSVSVVLGSFMMGLAVGSWLAGRLLHRIGDPLRIYALMELGIGLFALSFADLSRFIDVIFTLLVSVESPGAYALLVKALCSFLLLLVPTTMMGATLPLLTEFFRRRPRHTFSWKAGLLYAANTFGAAAGTIVVSFFLIELLGIHGTTLSAALGNIAIAVVAFSYARSSEPLPPGEGSAFTRKLDSVGLVALAVLGASGATALASEVLWTRTIESLIGNSTYAFATILVVYLLGIAIGSWAFSLLVNRLTALPLWLAGMQLAMGIWTVIAILLFQGISGSLAQSQGQLVPLASILGNYLKVVTVLVPLSLLSGACFPLATRIIDPGRQDARGVLIARAYSWNTVGAVAGSLIAGFLIVPFFDYLRSLYLLAAIYSLTALAAAAVLTLPAFRDASRRPIVTALGTVSFVLLVVSALGLTDGDDFRRRLESNHPSLEVVYHRPGLQGVTTVLKDRKDALAHILLVNGMGMTRKITDTKMMAHLPMLLHPDPRDTLVICFGMGTTYRSAVSHGGNVTAVELTKEVLDVFEHFHGDAAQVRAYPKGKLVVNDGRNFLKLTRDRFDIITVDPPPPIDAAGVNHLYSREFIELAKARLKKGGIMAHWIPRPDTQSGVDDWKTFNMLVATFTDAFPYVHGQRGFHGVGLHLLGSMEPISMSPDRIRGRLDNGAIRKDIDEWDAVPFTYIADRTDRKLGDLRSFPRVTDDRPRLEFYLLTTWAEGGRKMQSGTFW